MKLHWGHGIFLFYAFFVSTLVIVVVKSRNFDNSLVYEDYYARDINYQQEFDRRQNSRGLTEGLRLDHTADGPALQFPAAPAGAIEGSVLLYRPSSKTNDRRAALAVAADGRMPLNVAGLPLGRYRVIVEWKKAGVGYYDELDLTL
ncbi:FixH family protein [Neolewinella lacunae]|uniref:FixH family protein n=1 Tax=Neolewinella lacunae TaxID=1517758 RepID=A0A923TA39_9BACT|nr:FixH family protein [Neolewinella lacunae]MBC6995743.1 FixH family protein [Neolewinella lacunae]MDN3636564.1 FixH family protein [Neolewinella lacunae]